MHNQPTPVTYRPIQTQMTDQIEAAARFLMIRCPALIDFARSAASNDDALQRIITMANNGDRDAATATVWALLPKASGIIRSRYRSKDWRTVIDEYLGALYIAIATIDPNEPSTLLAEKLLSRARRRVARELSPHIPAPTEAETLESHLPWSRAAEDIAVARVELDEVVTAVRDRQIPRLRPTTWDRFVAHFDRGPTTVAMGPDRMAVMRVTRRLRLWRDQQAA